MELLSFTYIFIEMCILILIGYGLFTSWLIILSGIIAFIFYPIFYEILLTVFFRVHFKLISPEKHHMNIHKSGQRTNGFCYHDNYNLNLFTINQFYGIDLIRSKSVLNSLIEQSPELNFAFFFKQNEPNYPQFYNFATLRKLILLNYSAYLSYVFQRPLFFIPNVLLRFFVLRKMIHQTQGTTNGVCLAVDKGMAVNLGGGFHHADFYSSSGFCPYNDIGLAIQHLWHFHPQFRNVLIIDFNGRQGNGPANDKLLLIANSPDANDPSLELIKKRIFIVDFFNNETQIPKGKSRQATDFTDTFDKHDDDRNYLNKVRALLVQTKQLFSPQFIIYLAGTDILKKDQTGFMNITADGIRLRDELVFQFANDLQTPILLLLSGGFRKENTPVIVASLINLTQKFKQLKYSPGKN